MGMSPFPGLQGACFPGALESRRGGLLHGIHQPGKESRREEAGESVSTDKPRTTRFYFGIGVEGVSKPANLGAVLRTAHAFGAAFCFSIGAGWDARAGRSADTADTPAHVPFYRFATPEELILPARCELVGVERVEDAIELPSFRHPPNAAYVLGPERAGLSPALLARCRHVVRIPTRFSLNLAVAGALVLYDRLLQHGRFAERPVGAGGPHAAPPVPTGHGHPVFRRNVPDWARGRGGSGDRTGRG